MNIAAARIDDYDPNHVLRAIHDGFEPATLHLNYFERLAIKSKQNVCMDEVPESGKITIVTAESLFRSTLFEHKTMVINE
jgi:hypothetical protein